MSGSQHNARVRRVAFAALCLAVLALVGATGASSTGGEQGPLGIAWDGHASQLTRLDPLSLEPLSGSHSVAGVLVGGAGALSSSLSPDGLRLALAIGDAASEPRQRVEVIDLERMEVVRTFAFQIAPSVLAWTTSGRIVAFVESVGVMSADLATGKVRRLRSLGSTPERAERAGDALVLLLTSMSALEPARLVHVSAGGRVRVVALRRVRIGTRAARPDGRPAERLGGGLALTPDGRRAFVVAPRAPVAVIDLRTFRVRYHDLHPARATAKVLNGTDAEAAWLGSGRLAIWGRRYATMPRFSVAPTGLKIVDSATWAVSTLDARATDARVVGGALVAYGGSRNAALAAGMGLSVFAPDGLRYHVLGDELVDEVQAWGPYVYALVGETVHVVELASGRPLAVLHRPYGLPLFLDE